jgi:hypothetical protein
MTATRYITTEPAGAYPAGLRLDYFTRTNTGGPAGQHARGAHLDRSGDRQFISVTHPNGLTIKFVPAWDLAGLAAVGIAPADLAGAVLDVPGIAAALEINPDTIPAAKAGTKAPAGWTTCRTHHRPRKAAR